MRIFDVVSFLHGWVRRVKARLYPVFSEKITVVLGIRPDT